MSDNGEPNLLFTDGLDFMKKMWGAVSLPSAINPTTTDLNELDKRISDLKAVENWLNINLGMLRATIQGLEVQRGTIATIQSFSEHLGLGGSPIEAIHHAIKATQSPQGTQAGQAGFNASVSNANAQEASKAMVSNAAVWWDLLREQFKQMTDTKNTPESNQQAQKTDEKKAAAPKKSAVLTPRNTREKN